LILFNGSGFDVFPLGKSHLPPQAAAFAQKRFLKLVLGKVVDTNTVYFKMNFLEETRKFVPKS
jgi:hypothetical protein